MSSYINTICLRDYSFLIVQNWLTLDRWAYLWCLSSIAAVYMSFFILVPLCFDDLYYIFVISFEIREYESFNFVLFLQECWGYSRALVIIDTFENWLFYFWKKQRKEILLQITSPWVVLTLNNIVFQAMNRRYHSIYLSL